MHVESIKLKNFKSFKEVTMLDIPHYCVIVGANGINGNKSTLFDAIRIPERLPVFNCPAEGQ